MACWWLSIVFVCHASTLRPANVACYLLDFTCLTLCLSPVLSCSLHMSFLSFCCFYLNFLTRRPLTVRVINLSTKIWPTSFFTACAPIISAFDSLHQTIPSPCEWIGSYSFFIHLKKQLESGIGQPPYPFLHVLAMHRPWPMFLAMVISHRPCPLRIGYLLVYLCLCPMRKAYLLVPRLLHKMTLYPLVSSPFNILQFCIILPCMILVHLWYRHF